MAEKMGPPERALCKLGMVMRCQLRAGPAPPHCATGGAHAPAAGHGTDLQQAANSRERAMQCCAHATHGDPGCPSPICALREAAACLAKSFIFIEIT